MTLIQSTHNFLNQVELFYQSHDSANYLKLLAIECARNEMKIIEGCEDCEHPMRIVAIRRMLSNTLPHMGYEEHSHFDKALNMILDHCRKRLSISQTN